MPNFYPTVRNEAGQFVQGSQGNPSGRWKANPLTRKMQKEARDEIIQAFCKVMLLTGAELQELNQSPHSSGIERLASAIMINAINKGDAFRAQFLMNYVIGKPVAFNGQIENKYAPIVLAYANGEALSPQDDGMISEELDEPVKGIDEEE